MNENKDNANTNQSTNKASFEIKPNFDKEHLTIERIFRISLDESVKFLYLEFFHAQLLSQDKEIAFRISQLDDIMIQIINNEERVSKIINEIFFIKNFLETHHTGISL